MNEQKNEGRPSILKIKEIDTAVANNIDIDLEELKDPSKRLIKFINELTFKK